MNLAQGSLEIEELNAEGDRLPQLISLQNSGIDSDLLGCNYKPQAVRKTPNSDPLTGALPVSAWCRGRYPLRQTLPLYQQADRRRREKDKE